MPFVGQGGTVKLEALYRNGSGQAADATNVSMQLRNPGGTVIYGPLVIPPIVDEPGVGNYSYTWTTTGSETLGTWTAEWSGIIAGVDVQGNDYVEVVLAGSVVTEPLEPELGKVAAYVTPKRFRLMGLGLDLSDQSALSLRAILVAASRAVDTYCTVPSAPQRYSFFGGTVTDQAIPWDMGRRRVFLTHRPAREISSFKIYATNDVTVDISPDQLFLEPQRRWAEIVAFSLSPMGFWAATDLVSLTSPVARVSYSYGYSFPVVDEQIQPTETPGEYMADNGWWDENATVTVKKNDVTQSSGFTLHYEDGILLFDIPPAASDDITISYSYRVPQEVALATALIAQTMLAEDSLISKGMGGLAEIQVEEVRLRRDSRRTGTMVENEAVPPAARSLLAPYRQLALA